MVLFRIVPLTLVVAHSAFAADFASRWPQDADRTWVGSAFWANRLQDWQIHNGRLECLADAADEPMRTVHLLTHRLGAGPGPFTIEVHTGSIGNADGGDGAVGFLVGVGGDRMDYRASALVHRNPGAGGGLFAGITASGHAFIRSFETAQADVKTDQSNTPLPDELILRLTGSTEENRYVLTFTAVDAGTGHELTRVSQPLANPDERTGGIALVSHPGTGAVRSRFWFRDWTVSGEKIEAHPDRAFGPIACTQYTVDHGVLKLSAQMMPVGPKDEQTIQLQIDRGNGWKDAATTKLVVPGYTAPFRVEGWDATKDTPFRVVYRFRESDREPAAFTWEGTIRRDPTEKPTIVLAALSCCEQFGGGPRGGGTFPWANRTWFPHADLVPNLAKHEPDLFFFAGDQIYEGNPTPPIRAPLDEALLDYLYKWYLWCWSFGDLVRDTPCITIPDDHDVYQGNIWGDGGRPAQQGDPAGLRGGYGMPPEWLNAMQRTQTSHLPDPYDSRPVEQGIGVYYTSLTLGRVGFAIVEDRKFKSFPSILHVRMTPDSHILDPDFDTHDADVPGAKLLGDRQIEFLRAFAQDWSGQDLKAALSQTIFCNLQVSSRGVTAGQLDRDLDSNGWPQSGRARALRALRSGLMVHVAGDQHLASTIHQGIDQFEDGPWSLCTPAIANLYPRFWNPNYPPIRPLNPDRGPFTGWYEDGFHNKLAVYAVANPFEHPEHGQFPEPVELYREATGYSIVRFDKPGRTITFEVWPRFVDPASGKPYDGWPITVQQADNDGRAAAAWLPTLKVHGLSNPVVQIIREAGREVLYTLRIAENTYRPRVFDSDATYTIHVSDPEHDRVETREHVAPLGPNETRELVITF